MDKFKTWLTSATTGQGAAVLLGTALAYLQGSADTKTALIGLASGIALIAFPERTGVSTAAGVAMKDIEGALEIYLTGVKHGMGGKEAALQAISQAGGAVVADVATVVETATKN